MRTDESRPRGLASASLRSAASQARRWASELGPRARGVTAAGAVLLALAAGYVATAGHGPGERAPRGHVLLAYEVDPGSSRPWRSPDPEASAAFGDHRGADQPGSPAALRPAGPAEVDLKTFDSVARKILDADHLSWPGGRDERREQSNERMAERMIADMGDGIESADVRIRRSARAPGSRSSKVAALVRVTMSDGRRLSTRNIQAIRAILKGNEPDLTPEAITILDKTGWTYSDAGDPRAGTETMARVRESEIEAEIKQKLDWIDGARVSVRLQKNPPPEPATVAEPATAPAVVLNGPAEVAEVAPAPPSPPPAESWGKAMILVQVPISHYLRAYRTLHRREATRDELMPFAAKVDQTIRKAIDFAVPPSEVADVPTIVRIDDAGTAPPPTPLRRGNTSPTRAGGSRPGWPRRWPRCRRDLPRMLTARRPKVPSAAVPRAHFEVNDDSGPSGRVRDLIRRDPAAAAGVLHRWIGQGGSSS